MSLSYVAANSWSIYVAWLHPSVLNTGDACSWSRLLYCLVCVVLTYFCVDPSCLYPHWSSLLRSRILSAHFWSLAGSAIWPWCDTTPFCFTSSFVSYLSVLGRTYQLFISSVLLVVCDFADIPHISPAFARHRMYFTLRDVILFLSWIHQKPLYVWGLDSRKSMPWWLSSLLCKLQDLSKCVQAAWNSKECDVCVDAFTTQFKLLQACLKL